MQSKEELSTQQFGSKANKCEGKEYPFSVVDEELQLWGEKEDIRWEFRKWRWAQTDLKE